MSGADMIVPLQLAQPLQRGHDLLIAAPPQIRAAAGAAEQGVSGEQHIPHLQRNGALGVPRGVEDLNVKGAHRDVVSLVIEVQPIHLSRQGKQRVARPVGVGMMDIDGRLGQGLLQLRDGGGVVIVAVGEQDMGR